MQITYNHKINNVVFTLNNIYLIYIYKYIYIYLYIYIYNNIYLKKKTLRHIVEFKGKQI